MRKLLIVDDEVNVLNALRRTLRQKMDKDSLQIELFTEPLKALERCTETVFDIVISDYRMPQMDGVTFLKAVKEIQPDAVRLMLSASSEMQAVINAVNEAEVFRYVTKPWHADELDEIIRLAVMRRDQTLEDRRLADEVRLKRGELTPQELEARRLEEEEPGITKVNWGPDGSVHFE